MWGARGENVKSWAQPPATGFICKAAPSSAQKGRREVASSGPEAFASLLLSNVQT